MHWSSTHPTSPCLRVPDPRRLRQTVLPVTYEILQLARRLLVGLAAVEYLQL